MAEVGEPEGWSEPFVEVFSYGEADIPGIVCTILNGNVSAERAAEFRKILARRSLLGSSRIQIWMKEACSCSPRAVVYAMALELLRRALLDLLSATDETR
jgi:hypothetical protein